MSPISTIDYRMIDRLRDLGVAGGPDPIASISQAFITESAIRLQKMARAFAAGDHAAVRDLAVEFKGMSGTIGAMGLYALCREIETAESDLVDPSRLERIGEEIGRVSAALASASTH